MDITNTAVEKLKEVLKAMNKGDCLRVFLTEGCCGPSVGMDIANGPEKDDAELSRDGLKLFVAKDAVSYLEKATIDCDPDGELMMKGLPAHGHEHGGCDCGDGGCGSGGCDCGH